MEQHSQKKRYLLEEQNQITSLLMTILIFLRFFPGNVNMKAGHHYGGIFKPLINLNIKQSFLFFSSRFEYIDGAGHWVHSQKPKEFLDIVVDSLRNSK